MKKTINTLLICLIVINVALSEENTENIQLELKKKEKNVHQVTKISRLKELHKNFKAFLENELNPPKNSDIENDKMEESNFRNEYKYYLKSLNGIYINGDLKLTNNQSLEGFIGVEYRLLRRGKEEIKNKIIINEIDSLIENINLRNKNNFDILIQLNDNYLQRKIKTISLYQNILYKDIEEIATELQKVDKSLVFPFSDIRYKNEIFPSSELKSQNDDITIPIIKKINLEKIIQLYLYEKQNTQIKLNAISSQQENMFLSEYKDLNIFANLRKTQIEKKQNLTFVGGVSFSFPLSKDIFDAEKLLSRTFYIDKKNKVNKELEDIYSKAYEYAININHYGSLIESKVYQAKIELAELERDIFLTEKGLTEPRYTLIFKNFLDLLTKLENIVYYKYMAYMYTKQLATLLNLPKEKIDELVEYGGF